MATSGRAVHDPTPTLGGVALGLAIAVAVGAPAAAQTAGARGDKGPAPSNGPTLPSEVIVHAMRRDERLQTVPATITALTAGTLVTTGTKSLDQVADLTPGFFVTKLGDIRPRLYIRGLGTREYDPGAEASVGVFVDDVYIGRISNVLSTMHDIERVEVLKGPQATIYPRNTIGGAINVLSKPPSDNFGLEATAGVGTYGARDLFVAVSGPLGSEKLVGRVMAYDSSGGGFVRNLATSGQPLGVDNWGGRAILLGKPSPNLRITLTADLERSDGSSVGGKSIGSPTDPGGTFFSGTTIGVAGAPKPIAVADRFADYYNRDPTLHRHTETVSGKIEYDTPAGTLTSISAYRGSSLLEARDFDATSLDAVGQVISEHSHQATQEFRFTSLDGGTLSAGGLLQWMAGVFFYADNTNRTDEFDFGPASISAIRTGSPQTDLFGGRYQTRSWASFGEATLKINDRFSLAAGVRYTEDRKRLDQTDKATSPGAGFIGANFSVPDIPRNDDAWTPKVLASYRLSENTLAYASFNRGFKGGGFQYIPTSAAAAATTFRPEKSDAYETGLKTQFWESRATLNFSAFHYDIRDLQTQRSTTLVNGSIAIVTNNAEQSAVNGVDLDASLRVVPGLTVDGSYSYLDAQFIQFHTNAPGQPLTPATDFAHTPLMRSPRSSAHLGAQYDTAVRNNDTLTYRVDWSYRSRVFFEPGGGSALYGAAIPMTTQAGYGLLDASLTYTHARTRLRAYVDNVLDRAFLSDTQKLPFNYVVQYPGQPRTFGVSISYKL